MPLKRKAAIGHHDQAQFVEILTALMQVLLKEYFIPLWVGWRGTFCFQLGLCAHISSAWDGKACGVKPRETCQVYLPTELIQFDNP